MSSNQTLFTVIALAGAVVFGIGVIGGAGYQYSHDKANYDALTAVSDFDRGSEWGMRYCARDPLHWDCLSPEQQDAAKQYAREHARP